MAHSDSPAKSDEYAYHNENRIDYHAEHSDPSVDKFEKNVVDITAPPPPLDPETKKRLIRKLDIRIVPMVMWMYLMSFMDRGMDRQLRQGEEMADNFTNSHYWSRSPL